VGSGQSLISSLPTAHCPLLLFYCFSDTPPGAAPQVRSGFTKQFGFVPDDA
jgi:hypothetical protein